MVPREVLFSVNKCIGIIVYITNLNFRVFKRQETGLRVQDALRNTILKVWFDYSRLPEKMISLIKNY